MGYLFVYDHLRGHEGEKILEVGGGSAQLYWGNYEDYLRAQSEVTTPQEAEPRREKKTTPIRSTDKITTSKNQARRLKDELEQLEEAIAEAEIAISSLEGRMSVPGFYDDSTSANEIIATHKSLKDQLEKLFEEWEALAEKQESNQ